MNEQIEQYKKLLRWHDWWHEYSDDSRAWREGRQQREEIYKLQRVVDPDYRLYNEAAPKELRMGGATA